MLLTLFLKGVFILINKVEIANTNTSKLKVLTHKENKELFLKTNFYSLFFLSL